MKQQVLADMLELQDEIRGHVDRKRLDGAIDSLTESLDPDLWVDDFHPQPRGGWKVFERERQTVAQLDHLLWFGRDWPWEGTTHRRHFGTAGTVRDLIDRIVSVDRALAEIAIADARGGNPWKLWVARKELQKGNDEAAEGEAEDAIEHYRHAWRKALQAGTAGTDDPDPWDYTNSVARERAASRAAARAARRSARH